MSDYVRLTKTIVDAVNEAFAKDQPTGFVLIVLTEAGKRVVTYGHDREDVKMLMKEVLAEKTA